MSFWKAASLDHAENVRPFPFRFKWFLNYSGAADRPERMFARAKVKPATDSPSVALSVADTEPKAAQDAPTTNKPARTPHERIADCLGAPLIDIDVLKKLSWAGVPRDLRPLAWRVLFGYLPCTLEKHTLVLSRRRQEYRAIVQKYFGTDVELIAEAALQDASSCVARFRAESNLDLNEDTLHQIGIDVLRTCPADCLDVFQTRSVRHAMLRILYCWSIRRPATGYVQGINDLVTPFLDVFLAEADVGMQDIEADVFWCFSNLLDSIQDNYTFNQSGIHRQVSQLHQICARMDPHLVEHIAAEGLDFLQFAFRWMNCLLLREFRLRIIERFWDAYLAEESGFKDFHVFVCAAFLLHWRGRLMGLDFQDLIVFLQTLPTAKWTDSDVEMLLAEAFVLKSLWGK